MSDYDYVFCQSAMLPNAMRWTDILEALGRAVSVGFPVCGGRMEGMSFNHSLDIAMDIFIKSKIIRNFKNQFHLFSLHARPV